MYLYLLELTFSSENHRKVEDWIAQSDLEGGFLHKKQYGDQMLAIFGSQHILFEERLKMHQHPLITFLSIRRSFVYRLICKTKDISGLLATFPRGDNEDWYITDRQTAYFSLPSRILSDKQVAWLAISAEISSWDTVFEIPTRLPE